MPFGGKVAEYLVAFVQCCHPGQVRSGQIAGAADNLSHQVLQGQGPRQVMRRLDQQIERAFDGGVVLSVICLIHL